MDQTGNNILVIFFFFSQVLRESIPRQVDKKSGGPQGEKGQGFSRKS